MPNLNKYTKAELISKIQNTKPKLEIQNSNSITEKIISNILLFKSLILKLTLITFIIRWIRKYSLIRRLWQVFSMIGSTLLGFSLVDIYAFDFINWIKDTNFYRWYSELFNIKSEKIIVTKTEIKEPSSIMRTFDTNTTRDETKDEEDYGIIRRIHKITNPEPVINQEDIENPSFYSKNKYWIIGAASISCLIGWYYYGDNLTPVINSGIEKLRTGYGAIIDYLSSFRPSPPDDSTGTNSSGSAISNTMTDRSNLRERLDKLFKTPDLRMIDKTPDRIIGDAASEIELLDNIQASSSKIDKGKGVLTSPSLENLNNQAAESWGSRSSSPKSDSSSSTVTPNTINVKIPENQKSVTSEFIPDSPIDSEPLEYVTKTWKFMFVKDIREKMTIMDQIWEMDGDFSKEQSDTMADSLAFLISNYNLSIENFNNSLTNLQPEQIRAGKQSFYHFRCFLSSYYDRIVTDEENPITIGGLTDEVTAIIIK